MKMQAVINGISVGLASLFLLAQPVWSAVVTGPEDTPPGGTPSGSASIPVLSGGTQTQTDPNAPPKTKELRRGTSKPSTDSSTLRHKTSRPVSPYTQIAGLPGDLVNFVSNMANKCQPNDTRDICFMRYIVVPTGAGPGQPQYRLTANSLQCPAGYFITNSFGNTVIDLNDPTVNINYYSAQTFSQITETTYNAISSANFLCTRQPDAGRSLTLPIETGHRCVHSSCGGPLPQMGKKNGYMTWKVQTGYESNRKTLNGGAGHCNSYDVAGCPAWCSEWPWERYELYYVSCSRAAGFYRDTGTPEITATASSLYTPSVVICSKSSIVWK